jgi:osmotically-inducible protein OsmY
MKNGADVSRWAALALVLTLTSVAGCVVVIGGDKDRHRADVQWAATPDRATPAAPRATDGSLARQVESRLQTDSAIQGEDISVSSSGNVVTLHGRVSDLVRLEHAMRLAADVPGVTRVVSRLTVEMEAG